MVKTKIKINREQLVEQIEKLYRDASGWDRPHGGESQLYGRHDGEEVYDFFVSEFIGHNSWVAGDNIVPIATVDWFDPLEHEDYGEWFEHEKESLVYDSWEEFASAEPEKWDEMQTRWRDIWLDVNLPDMVRCELDRIEENGELEVMDDEDEA